MQQKKKRDARGIPRDRDAGTAILGVSGVKSKMLGDSGKSHKDLDHPLYSLITRTPTDAPTKQPLPLLPGELLRQRDALGWTQQRMASAIAKQLSSDAASFDEASYPFALNLFDVETYRALERGTARLTDEQARAVWQIFEEHQRPQDAERSPGLSPR